MMKLSSLIGIISLLAAARQNGREAPKPQKEHELLKQFEGEWEARMKYSTDPNKPPVECSGVETAKVALGGFWLIFGYKGESDGKSVEGSGLMGYDPVKKKYVGTWTDSSSPHLYVMEGEADTAGKVFTLTGEGIDPVTRKTVREKIVHAIRDADSRSLTFYRLRHDGAETKTGEAEYIRKK